MALNDVTFNRGQGGLGRPLAGEDHISGLIGYVATGSLPGPNFTATDRIKVVYSLEGAEALGIVQGTAALAAIWYHISEFFRMQPKGVLYVALYDSAIVSMDVIEDVQNFSDGKIRQIAVFDPTVLPVLTIEDLSTNVGALQTKCTLLESEHKPIQVLYTMNLTGVDLADLPDLRTFAKKNVSVVIGEDAGGIAATLTSTNVSVSCIGAVLGAVSAAKVNENIGWVSKFDFAGGGQLTTPAFSTAVLVKDTATSQLDSLNTYHYIFLRQHVGLAGTFANDSYTTDVDTSDYATIENNRTIDKAVRGVRTLLLPHLNSPLLVNADGTLTEDTVGFFTNEAGRALEQMERNEEVSAFAVTIDPTQNVLSTSTLEINIKVIPVGVARQIQVNIGFTVKI